MKLLLDHDVYGSTVHFLAALGHDVVTVAQLNLAQASDEQLIRLAKEQGRILVTRDRDFGELVFISEINTGVLYLRMIPPTRTAVHAELEGCSKRIHRKSCLRLFWL
jgi:predicted nuclease of predicted toxin-antitoxin system